MGDLPIILGICGEGIGIYLGILSLDHRFNKNKHIVASSVKITNLQPSTDLQFQNVPPFWIVFKIIGDFTSQIFHLILLVVYNVGILLIIIEGF